jgi:hypothetical protein
MEHGSIPATPPMQIDTIIYMAHPVGAPTPQGLQDNLTRAKKWVRWIFDHYPNTAVLANWLYECEVLDDFNPEHRKLGLQHDFAILRRCDELWLVGGRVSNGMMAERQAAWNAGIPVRDLTPLGDWPPARVSSLANFLAPPPELHSSPHPDDVGREF